MALTLDKTLSLLQGDLVRITGRGLEAYGDLVIRNEPAPHQKTGGGDDAIIYIRTSRRGQELVCNYVYWSEVQIKLVKAKACMTNLRVHDSGGKATSSGQKAPTSPTPPPPHGKGVDEDTSENPGSSVAEPMRGDEVQDSEEPNSLAAVPMQEDEDTSEEIGSSAAAPTREVEDTSANPGSSAVAPMREDEDTSANPGSSAAVPMQDDEDTSEDPGSAAAALPGDSVEISEEPGSSAAALPVDEVEDGFEPGSSAAALPVDEIEGNEEPGSSAASLTVDESEEPQYGTLLDFYKDGTISVPSAISIGGVNNECDPRCPYTWSFGLEKSSAYSEFYVTMKKTGKTFFPNSASTLLEKKKNGRIEPRTVAKLQFSLKNFVGLQKLPTITATVLRGVVDEKVTKLNAEGKYFGFSTTARLQGGVVIGQMRRLQNGWPFAVHAIFDVEDASSGPTSLYWDSVLLKNNMAPFLFPCIPLWS